MFDDPATMLPGTVVAVLPDDDEDEEDDEDDEDEDDDEDDEDAEPFAESYDFEFKLRNTLFFKMMTNRHVY